MISMHLEMVFDHWIIDGVEAFDRARQTNVT